MVDIRMTSQLDKLIFEYDENRGEVFIKDLISGEILGRRKVENFENFINEFTNEVNILRSRYKTTKKKSFFE